MGALIELHGLTKDFGGHTAVDSVDLHLEAGETFSLLGPSGCGKTTILRMLGGFLEPDAGRILLDGQDITHLPPNRRPVNTVFQNYALFPHLSVWENIAFGLKAAGRPSHEIKKEIARMLALIRLDEHAEKKPHQLSGGQKQRVAIARALVNHPRLLLLDEPLAALDKKLRQHMLVELDRIHDEVGITFLYVTHDQSEAMSLSDRIAVMNNGRIEQLGRPSEIYESPANRFVAGFIGDSNFLNGTTATTTVDNYLTLSLDEQHRILAWDERRLNSGQNATLSLRPEKIRLLTQPPAENGKLWNVLPGKVADMVYLGSETRYRVETAGLSLHVLQQHQRCQLDEKPATWGDQVWLTWHADDGCILPPE